MGLFKNPLIFTFAMLALIIPIDEVVLYLFVYRKKKYVNYCKEFEKESRTTKLMWSAFLIALFVFAVILFLLIFRFRQLYLPKPI